MSSSTTSSYARAATQNGATASSPAATPLHVLYCFDALIESLHDGRTHKPTVKHKWNGDKFPLFVTWKKRSSSVGEWRLRGCIGTFSPKELSAGLREYALIAALQDSRFSPIVLSELAHLRCDISLLTHFESASHLFDWTIGRHGVTLEFSDPTTGRSYSATFLPEVAYEQGWSAQQTIDELVHKAGFRGRLTNELRQRMKLTRYRSAKEGLSFAQYAQLRAQLAGPESNLLASLLAVHWSQQPIARTSLMAANGVHADADEGSDEGEEEDEEMDEEGAEEEAIEDEPPDSDSDSASASPPPPAVANKKQQAQATSNGTSKANGVRR